MSTFSSEIVDGHTIVTINNAKFLLDTGSPFSFGNVSTISIDGKNFSLQRSTLGMNIEAINRLSGLQIDGLIGMNILKQFDFRITTNETFFSSKTFSHAEKSIHLPIVDSIMTIPRVQIEINGTSHRAYFDTGAKLSYADETLLEGAESIGDTNDFHPSVGHFTVKTYRMSINIGGAQHAETMVFGVLPPSLKSLLFLTDTKAILGGELIQRYNVVVSNLTNKILLEEKS